MSPAKTIAAQLNAAQLAINNSLADEEIQALVEGFGYTAEKLGAGSALYDSAMAAVSAQKSAAGAQQLSTQALQTAQTTAFDAYQALSRVARAVCDPAQLTALDLNGIMPRLTAAFLAKAYTLFDNAASLTALSDFGYDPAKLSAERAKISAYDQANQRQEAAKGAAQQATREQVAALQALSEWTSQYTKIVRVALREKPQLLEKLGILARTSKTTAQRAATQRKKTGGA